MTDLPNTSTGIHNIARELVRTFIKEHPEELAHIMYTYHMTKRGAAIFLLHEMQHAAQDIGEIT